MEIEYGYQINQTGEQIIVTDSTGWGVSPNPNRSAYALFAGVVKFFRNSDDTFLEKANGYNYSYYSPDFDNTVRSVFRFNLGTDGYHVIKLIPVILNNNTATLDGSLYFNTIEQQIYRMKSGSWEAVSYEEMILDPDIIGVSVKKVAVHPKFEKMLDKIWKSYEEDAFPKNGADYNNFYLGYGMMIGAIASLKQGSWEEYDRKITLATQLSKRWI